MIKVAITDDHLLILKGISDLLTSLNDVEVAGAWLDARTTREGLEEVRIDVLFLDINLPDGDGVDLCAEFTKRYPHMKIIALTTFNQVAFIKNMLANGASGYLLKNTSLNEIDKAINAVTQGQTYLQEEVRILLESGSSSTHTTDRPQITRREKDVLVRICDEMTTAEIAENLFISVKTVETHRQNLIHKFNVRNTAGLVKEAINGGYLE